MNLLPALAAHLAGLGHGTYSTTTPYQPGDVAIVLGAMPATPDRCVALTVQPGPQSNTSEPYDTPHVRVRVRGTADERVAREHAQNVYDALHGLGVTDLPGGVRVFNVVGLQSAPVYVGIDANSRHECAANFFVEYLNPSALRPDL